MTIAQYVRWPFCACATESKSNYFLLCIQAPTRQGTARQRQPTLKANLARDDEEPGSKTELDAVDMTTVITLLEFRVIGF
jgi:hypothetical protein